MVTNPTTGPGHIGIDNPSAASAPFLGSVLFSGWALNDNTAVSSVSVTIDGIPYGSAAATSRPDICATYPGRSGCPNVGWTFGLDTTSLTDGTHTLGITENNANGTFYTVSSNFTVANYTAGNPLIIVLDTPTNQFGTYGSVNISGWATLASQQIATIKIAIDGVPLGNATYGIQRSDVCLVTSSPSCPNVGWSFSGFNTQMLPNGTHFIDVTAVTVLGQTSTISSQIKIAN
jgi:hypothetical protein